MDICQIDQTNRADIDAFLIRQWFCLQMVVHGETIDLSMADGWYAFGIVPVIKGKLHAKARYQCYRPQKEWGTAKTSYEAGVNYFFTKNLEMHLEYARINDRSLTKHNYNMVDVELDFRF